MKDTIISVFFSNGDLLKIDLAEEIKERESNIKTPHTLKLDKITMDAIESGGLVCSQCIGRKQISPNNCKHL